MREVQTLSAATGEAFKVPGRPQIARLSRRREEGHHRRVRAALHFPGLSGHRLGGRRFVLEEGQDSGITVQERRESAGRLLARAPRNRHVPFRAGQIHTVVAAALGRRRKQSLRLDGARHLLLPHRR